MRIQSCLFANETYCFFAFLIGISIAIAKAPYWHKGEYIYCVRKKRDLMVRWPLVEV